MRSVTVALIATLLPLCVLVAGLGCLSLYLYGQLRKARAESRRLGAESKRLDAEAETLRQQLPQPKAKYSVPVWPEPYEPEERDRVSLSPESEPRWGGDYRVVHGALADWPLRWPATSFYTYGPLKSEDEIKRIFDELGYQGISPHLLLPLLEPIENRHDLIENIGASVAHRWTSGDSDPEHTLFPFPSVVYRDMETFYKAIEGIQFSPEFSAELRKFPTEIALKHGEVNKKNLEKMMLLLDELFRHLANPLERSREVPDGGFAVDEFYRELVSCAISCVVKLKLRMLGSRQQFEIKWGETNDQVLCVSPAMYTHAGVDGVPLEKPRQLENYRYRVITKTEAGVPRLGQEISEWPPLVREDGDADADADGKMLVSNEGYGHSG
ncbi:hypothetical protein PVAG01_08058 [Phlyctema vagabunda]|uniref:Uncharacterized protein n=1 Tax=Phlyctema vagabunda TaxID=108571 RepID=A0ABR4P8B1_9HELO